MSSATPNASMQVDVILPALNEAEALRWVLPRVPVGYRAIVVDNGSTDSTSAVAAELGAMVVSEARRGFGAACAAGLDAATASVVAFCDADASFDPADLPLVCDPVLSGAVQLMLGARTPVVRSAWPPHARVANRFLAWRLRRLSGFELTDLGPMRAAGRVQLIELGIQDRRFGWPLEMVLRAATEGWVLGETPVPYHPRVGRSKVTGTVRGTFRAVSDMSAVLRELG